MFQLEQQVEAEIDIKNSRFISIISPIKNKHDALAKLGEIKSRWPDARHYCAVILSDDGSMLDDDGEPSGTAAKPMYNVLMHKSLHNVIAVVVRYFGGVKLGAGGLVRAYSQAVSDALKTATLQEVVTLISIGVMVDFPLESRLRHLCQQNDISIANVTYDHAVCMQLQLPPASSDLLIKRLQDGLAGNMQLIGAD